MVKPKAIVYSRNLYRALLGSLGTKTKTTIGGKTIRVHRDELDIELQRREVGPQEKWEKSAKLLRQLPETNRRSVTVEKIDLGEGVHLADPNVAHGADLQRYGIVIFDLDFDLAGDAGVRIAELLAGFDATGNYRTPALWSKIAVDAPHTFIFIQSKQRDMLPGDAPINQVLMAMHMFTGLAMGCAGVMWSHQLSLLGMDFFTHSMNLGQESALRHQILPRLTKGSKALKRWLSKATVFGSIKETLSTGTIFAPVVELTWENQKFIIAGARKWGESIVGVLPSTDLKPVEWVEHVVEMSETIFQPKLFSLTADRAPLDDIYLIVRKSNPNKNEKTNKTIIVLNYKGTPIPLQVQRQKGGESSTYNFKKEYLDLLKYIQRPDGLDKGLEGGKQKNLGKPIPMLSHLRKAVAAALLTIPLSEDDAHDLARKVVPFRWKKWRSIGVRVEFPSPPPPSRFS